MAKNDFEMISEEVAELTRNTCSLAALTIADAVNNLLEAYGNSITVVGATNALDQISVHALRFKEALKKSGAGS